MEVALYLFFVMILLTSSQRVSHQVIDAPRRLLQFAVRDAVRTVQPVTPRSESASKRLRSVVSTLASDSTLDITHIRLQKTNSDVRVPGGTSALRAAAEAAEDAIKGSLSRSVFNRLGRMPTINHTDALREQDPEGEEYENIANIRAENQVEFYERNQYGGSDAYMHDQEPEEATGSAPNINEYERYSGLGSRQSRLSSSAGKDSLVLGYVRGAAEVRGRRLMAQGTHAGSGPRPSEKDLNMSANTNMRTLPTHQTRDAAVSDLQVPMEKKVADARNSNVRIAHVHDTVMTDEAKVSFYLSFPIHPHPIM
jgi:hypothetical protein